MTAVDPTRLESWARHRSLSTEDTSMTYGRPLIVSVIRTRFTVMRGAPHQGRPRVSDSSGRAAARKRKRVRSCTGAVRPHTFVRRKSQNSYNMFTRAQAIHDPSTGFPQA